MDAARDDDLLAVDWTPLARTGHAFGGPAPSRTTVWNMRDGPMPAGAVLVANPSDWANPFRMAVSGMTRDQAVDAYVRWICGRMDLLLRLPEIRGRVLACWCHPARCHAHVLAALADAPPPWVWSPAAWAAGLHVRAA